MRMLVLFALGFGCGNDSSPQTYAPPVMTTGTGRPANATSVLCSRTEDCGYWHCRCEDGGLVNSAFCENGWCLDANGACPPACQQFSHGPWTGQASGGPVSSSAPDLGQESCKSVGTACSADGDCGCSGMSCGLRGCCVNANHTCNDSEDCCAGLLCTGGLCR